MKVYQVAVAVAGLSLVLAGCSTEEGVGPNTVLTTTASLQSESSAQAADRIKAAVPEVTNLVQVTEDNDPNGLIGRANGYDGGTIIFDSRLTCDAETEGTVCGALIEQWPTEADARRRAEYITGIQKAAPMLGSEYQTIRGALLLRVSGELKPSQAAEYEAAFDE